MTSHDINSASTNYEGNSFLSSKLIEEAVVASPTESTATTAKNEVADALDGLSPESPVLQSKDIVITYALMLLSLFDDTLRDLRSYGYGADSEQDAKKSSHAFRILSSLFAVEPLKQSYVVPPPSLASSATDSYEKWTRNVLEAVCWFNSLAADDIECLQHVQSEGVQLDSLHKILRLAIKKVSLPNGVQASHNTAVIVVSNLLTATFMYQDTHAQSATVATSAHFKILRYDARMRDAVRKLTQLLLVDADAANEADAWEQEKTRSFVQQRIEHSVCEYVLQEKRRQVETRAAMRHAKTQSLLSSNARGGIQRLSNSMKGTRGRDHGAADRPPPPPSPTTVGVQTAANLVEGTKSQEKSDANASSPGLSPSTRHKPDLKIDTSVKKPEAPKSGVMQWMYDGLTTPITNVGSIFSATARPPSAISASIESSAGPCMETIFGVLDMPDSFIVPTGLEDWFVKPVMAHASSLNAIICATGQVESADEFVDAWQFLPAFAPFSDIFALGFNTESRVKMSQEMSSFVSRTNELHAASGLRPAPVATFAAGLESLREESPEDVGVQTGRESILKCPTPPSIIDAWATQIAAAEVAGKELGQHVLNQSYGKRPVSLVGNGLGANVMYYALLEILTSIESGNNEEAFSLIDSVYLIGAPIPLDLSVWPKLSTLVNGRLVNAYSSQENYMSFLRDLDMDAEATDAAPFIGTTPISPPTSAPLSASTQQAFTPITHADAFPRTKVENTDLHSLLRHETKISGGTLPRIMERVGFERAFADTTHLIITNDAGASYLPERRRSRQASLRPPPARDNPPAAFETETLFDAERELLDMLDTFKAANIAAFIQTRPGISGQLSSAIAFEPAALILEPLSRPGSNRTLDEDEADREQASGWVGVGLEPLGAE